MASHFLFFPSVFRCSKLFRQQNPKSRCDNKRRKDDQAHAIDDHGSKFLNEFETLNRGVHYPIIFCILVQLVVVHLFGHDADLAGNTAQLNTCPMHTALQLVKYRIATAAWKITYKNSTTSYHVLVTNRMAVALWYCGCSSTCLLQSCRRSAVSFRPLWYYESVTYCLIVWCRKMVCCWCCCLFRWPICEWQFSSSIDVRMVVCRDDASSTTTVAIRANTNAAEWSTSFC